jgi:hypothetical protein
MPSIPLPGSEESKRFEYGNLAGIDRLSPEYANPANETSCA